MLSSPSGWITLLGKVLRKATKPIYYAETIVELKQDLKVEKIADISFNLHLCDLREPKAMALFQEAYPRKAALFQERIDKGVIGLGVLSDSGEVVTYIWFSTGDYFEPQLGITFHVEEHELYYFDGYVHPRFRSIYKCGLTSQMIMMNEFAKKGYKRAYCSVNIKNATSLKFHRVLGYDETGRILVTRHLLGKPFSVWRKSPRSYLKNIRKG